MASERRRATRMLIRTCEQLSARVVRALRADDPDRVLEALLAMAAFAIEGIENHSVSEQARGETETAQRRGWFRRRRERMGRTSSSVRIVE